MKQIYINRAFSFVAPMALAFCGTMILTDPAALNAPISTPSLEFVAEYDNHGIGGERQTEIVVSGDRRRLIPRSEEIQFYIQNNFSTPASVSYSVILTDEGGNEIMAEPTSSVFSLANGEATTLELLAPSYLSDGLYTWQITVAGAANGKLADSGTDLNFAILNDHFYILTNEEWFRFSLANGATSQ